MSRRKTSEVLPDRLRARLVSERERIERAVVEHEAVRSVERLGMNKYPDADAWEAACRGVQEGPLSKEHARDYRRLYTLDKALRTLDQEVKNGTDRAESLLWRTTLARTVEAGNVAETRKRELERSRNSDRLRKVEARAVVAAAPSPRLNAHELLTQGAAETRAAIDASYAPRLATCEALIAAAAAARGDLALLGKETSPARGRPAEGVLNILSADLMAGDFTRAEVAAFFRAGVTPESVRDVTPESVREVTPESVRERASAKRRARKAPVNNEPSPNAARIRQRFGLTREQAAEKIREYEEQDEKRGTPAALTTRVKKRAPNAR